MMKTTRILKQLILMIVSLAFVLLSCSNKEEDPIPKGSTGKYDLSAVDRYLWENRAAYNDHVAVLISQNGQVIYRNEINMSINTNLLIASASKWLSAGVIMSLVDEGKLSLDDTVGKFLPVYTTHHKGGITIRQLFSHTAGFASEVGASNVTDRYEFRKDLTLAQAVDSIAVHTPLVNQPGTKFNYCSTGMHIAGRIAEVVSGRSWQALFNEKIGAPCKMNADYLNVTTQNPLIAGGAHTNARGYLNFLEMLVGNGKFKGTTVLSERSVALMMSDQTANALIEGTPYPVNPYAPVNIPEVRYGVGNWLDAIDASGKVIETSSPGMFGAHPWQDTKHGIAGIIFTRTQPKKSNMVSLKIRQLIRDIVDNG